jgi:hypothetical protein
VLAVALFIPRLLYGPSRSLSLLHTLADVSTGVRPHYAQSIYTGALSSDAVIEKVQETALRRIATHLDIASLQAQMEEEVISSSLFRFRVGLTVCARLRWRQPNRRNPKRMQSIRRRHRRLRAWVAARCSLERTASRRRSVAP